MRRLLTRALVWSAALVGVLLVVGAGALLVWSAADRAASDDRHDVTTVAAVLAVTNDPDAVRGALARTAAGTEGRLAVHLPDGTTIGVGQGTGRLTSVSTVDGSRAAVEVSSPAPPGPGLPLHLTVLLLSALLALPAALLVGRRTLDPVLRALRVLADTASEIAHRDGNARIRVTGPPELTALATAINAAADRTERLLAKEREMIADVSHRLRTPLTALRLDADAIGEGPVADRIRSAVTALGHDVDRIIESLHPVSTAAATGTCDVAEVVKTRMGFWSAHAEDQGRPCEVDLPYEPTPVPLAPDALGAVVDALLENVFRHTPPRSALTVAVVRHAGWVTLAVEDGGPGVVDPERALHRGSSGGGSTGLGLDIARAAAEATGGTIHVERGRLGGARIRLRLGESDSHHEPAVPRAWRLWRGRA
ncbi:signal transduction histidine kinase [Saccharothrix tamanrassetensis]|uniref:Signal transduction histidine-protein kinase/phosphatase MprB n=1 Tax=Saccharothrix tamanrassetensis TaxID=1051531 RepID=A0A841CS69_9PSEU|nr:HAMP domain-containing sensor histidine kinase [Saccharothrix tamanrassetensis]MBB5960149.1 signal transduction histidine kinase [Saccharothrix tamanrassetensis]